MSAAGPGRRNAGGSACSPRRPDSASWRLKYRRAPPVTGVTMSRRRWWRRQTTRNPRPPRWASTRCRAERGVRTASRAARSGDPRLEHGAGDGGRRDEVGPLTSRERLGLELVLECTGAGAGAGTGGVALLTSALAARWLAGRHEGRKGEVAELAARAPEAALGGRARRCAEVEGRRAGRGGGAEAARGGRRADEVRLTLEVVMVIEGHTGECHTQPGEQPHRHQAYPLSLGPRAMQTALLSACRRVRRARIVNPPLYTPQHGVDFAWSSAPRGGEAAYGIHLRVRPCGETASDALCT